MRNYNSSRGNFENSPSNAGLLHSELIRDDFTRLSRPKLNSDSYIQESDENYGNNDSWGLLSKLDEDSRNKEDFQLVYMYNSKMYSRRLVARPWPSQSFIFKKLLSDLAKMHKLTAAFEDDLKGIDFYSEALSRLTLQLFHKVDGLVELELVEIASDEITVSFRLNKRVFYLDQFFDLDEDDSFDFNLSMKQSDGSVVGYGGSFDDVINKLVSEY